MIKRIILYSKEMISRVFFPIRVVDATNTLIKIRDCNKSISRFGDGEFDYLFGIGKSFQAADSKLSKRLSDILMEGGTDNCLVGIPYALYSLKPYNNKSRKFWLQYSAHNRSKLLPKLNRNATYYDSQISRIYINRRNPEDSATLFGIWKQIWANKRVLIIEGEYSRCGVGNDLFLNCTKVSRLICPAKNAFDWYESIYTEALRFAKEYDVVLLAIGPTATVLAYDLSKAGIWCIDMGNMDNEYEWMKKGVDHPVPNENKYSYEADGGNSVSEYVNERYDSEIIGRIC